MLVNPLHERISRTLDAPVGHALLKSAVGDEVGGRVVVRCIHREDAVAEAVLDLQALRGVGSVLERGCAIDRQREEVAGEGVGRAGSRVSSVDAVALVALNGVRAVSSAAPVGRPGAEGGGSVGGVVVSRFVGTGGVSEGISGGAT